jgi:hypothetical protein
MATEAGTSVNEAVGTGADVAEGAGPGEVAEGAVEEGALGVADVPGGGWAPELAAPTTDATARAQAPTTVATATVATALGRALGGPVAVRERGGFIKRWSLVRRQIGLRPGRQGVAVRR